ncbi:MAG: hypothetical protein KME12_17315 [Trichocoleus desertorum ATA4-8-CV12]|nr:hypothetical protein [Trichocoleus desertorum ATA4-8-CV12]
MQGSRGVASLHLKIKLLAMFSESPSVKKLYERLSHKVKVVSQDIENKVQKAIGDPANSDSINKNQPTHLDEMLILQTLKTIEDKARNKMEKSDQSWQ